MSKPPSISPSISPSMSSKIQPNISSNNVIKCPEMDYIEYIGYIILGIITIIFLWIIIYKLNGLPIILKLPFSYKMNGGIESIYSSKYLNIGE